MGVQAQFLPHQVGGIVDPKVFTAKDLDVFGQGRARRLKISSSWEISRRTRSGVQRLMVTMVRCWVLPFFQTLSTTFI